MQRISEKQFKDIQKRMRNYQNESSSKNFIIPANSPKPIQKTNSRLPILNKDSISSTVLKIFFPIAPQSKERARTFVADISGRNAWAQAFSTHDMPNAPRAMKTVTPAKTRAYEKFIRDIALSSMLAAKLQPFKGPLIKYTIFRISGDPSEWPTSIHDGDVDNLEKALSDGMNKVVYEDDRLIVGNHHLKICSHSPGIGVIIRQAAQEDIDYMENILGGRGGI